MKFIVDNAEKNSKIPSIEDGKDNESSSDNKNFLKNLKNSKFKNLKNFKNFKNNPHDLVNVICEVIRWYIISKDYKICNHSHFSDMIIDDSNIFEAIKDTVAILK